MGGAARVMAAALLLLAPVVGAGAAPLVNAAAPASDVALLRAQKQNNALPLQVDAAVPRPPRTVIAAVPASSALLPWTQEPRSVGVEIWPEIVPVAVAAAPLPLALVVVALLLLLLPPT